MPVTARTASFHGQTSRLLPIAIVGARRLAAGVSIRSTPSIVSVRGLLALGLAIFGVEVTVLSAQAPASPPPPVTRLKLDTGKEIYDAGCVACHGPDGKGQSQNLAGFERPATFPDFSDCPTSTPEADVQWRSIITNGGSARAFSQIMPSFKDLLTQDQIGKAIDHLRSFCTEEAWPRGNLNFPRADDHREGLSGERDRDCGCDQRPGNARRRARRPSTSSGSAPPR